MNQPQIHSHAIELRNALLGHDEQAIRKHRDWLVGAVAAALLDQDLAAMRVLRAELSGLIALTDQCSNGGAGERWRALSEILQACSDTYKPLEQMRLAQPGRLSGIILRHINREPGVTPSIIAEKLNKKRSHISNELNALEKEGLIHKLCEGRNTHLYISGIGRSVLAGFSPLHISLDKTENTLGRTYPYADPARIRQPNLPLSGLVSRAA